ncbi:hypothetical protein [Clostridium cadaveris]|nr:hypothetical protein [Clostridium cadaveris]
MIATIDKIIVKIQNIRVRILVSFSFFNERYNEIALIIKSSV